MKREYVTPEIEIIDLYSKDIITDSRMGWDENNDTDNEGFGSLNG